MEIFSIIKYVVDVPSQGCGTEQYEAGDSSLGHIVKLDTLQFKLLLL